MKFIGWLKDLLFKIHLKSAKKSIKSGGKGIPVSKLFNKLRNE